MASLATHFSASLLLLPVGLRRLLYSSSLYLKNPSLFHSKPYYFSQPRYTNLDLYTLLLSLPIAFFSLLFLFLTLSPSLSFPSYRFSLLFQSQAVFLFWVLILLFLARESIDPFFIPESFVFLLAGITFFVEYSATGYGFEGIAAVCYGLLGNLTLLCCGCCLILAIRPTAFFAEFGLCFGLLFKGTWLIQSGLCLYTDAFALKGCQKVAVSPPLPASGGVMDVNCGLNDDRTRGVALINLLFVGHAIGVLIGSFVTFGTLAIDRNLRCGEASGPLLAQLEAESTLTMRSNPEFELE
ncbi:hypothetical protein HS088_TW01G00321 [Tripterygium wilfordii]|uniref:Uncharacterized protein n=1 Tax=Tripterygium wilfordii TaxID=458696 RepID=A0A7J7E163_TRIWF|nr:uncharacterized protein LOC119995188 [Tripterygium wilfordii]KAF5752412.1 hypothetical protein HS088_TW01G00321 [Tripterygium wilfordii]